MSRIKRGARPQDHWTMIANDAVRDERLSFKARGILAYLLSQADGWDTSIRRLAQSGPDGYAAIETGVKELVEAGYLTLDEQGRGDAGKYGANTWNVRDSLGEASDYPVTDNPVTDNPVTDNHRTKKNIPKKNLEEEQVTTDVVTYARSNFDDFWEVYPIHVGKIAARKAWATATKRALPADIIAGARRYRDDPNREEGFTAHPSTWLGQGRWEDDALPDRTARRKATKTEENMAFLGRVTPMELMRSEALKGLTQ